MCSHDGAARWGHRFGGLVDIGIFRQGFGVQREGVVTVWRNVRHNGIAAKIGVDACLIGDIGVVCARRFDQRSGLPIG